MIHIDEDIGTVLVTGHGARPTDEWDPHLRTSDLADRGLVELDELHPLLRKGTLLAIDDRMRRFPLFNDATTAIAARRSVGPGPAGKPDYMAVAPWSALPATTLGGVLMNSYFSLEQTLELTLRSTADQLTAGVDPFLVASHEAAHALEVTLECIPGAVVALARAVGAAIGRPDLQDLEELTPDDRLRIAEEIGRYGATGDLLSGQHVAEDPDAWTPWDAEGDAVAADPQSQRGELMAEALALDSPRNRRESKVVAAVCTLTEQLLGSGSAIGAAVNRALHRQHATASYLYRTRPAAVDALLSWGGYVYGSYPDLASDPDIAWELANPHRPPIRLVDDFAMSMRCDRATAEQKLMHAGILQLRDVAPSEHRIAIDRPLAPDAVSDLLPPAVLSAAVEEALRSAVHAANEVPGRGATARPKICIGYDGILRRDPSTTVDPMGHLRRMQSVSADWLSGDQRWTDEERAALRSAGIAGAEDQLRRFRALDDRLRKPTDVTPIDRATAVPAGAGGRPSPQRARRRSSMAPPGTTAATDETASQTAGAARAPASDAPQAAARKGVGRGTRKASGRDARSSRRSSGPTDGTKGMAPPGR